MSSQEGEYESGEHETEVKNQSLRFKPLTIEIAAGHLSLLKRVGYGFSHAFLKFDCNNQGITDISVMVNFQFLRFVILSHNFIYDLSPIFAAEYLIYLKTDYNKIHKAGTSKSLPYLRFLDLSHNNLTCTDYINHYRLNHLILNYNDIFTLKGIEGPPLNQFKLRSLETLELRGNMITSLDGLNNLYDLKTLYFSENLLHSVKGISDMKGLVKLHLRDNTIQHLDGFLEGPINLQYLNLRGNQIRYWSEIKKLASLSSLQALILSDNPITDREHYRKVVLGMIPHLQRLDKDKTSIEEVAESLEFFKKLNEQFFEEDTEEEMAKENEQLAEAKIDEIEGNVEFNPDVAEEVSEADKAEEMSDEEE